MFRLLRYFSIASLITTIIASFLLGTASRKIIVNDLIDLGESKNIALTQAFSNSLWPKFAPAVKSLSGLSPEELRNHPIMPELRKEVLALMKGLSVLKVKVYNLEGLTFFSTQESQIGEDKSTNPGFLAARSGKVANELTHRNTFSAFDKEMEDRDVLGSYVPIRRGGSTGPIKGVIEIYDDVTILLRNMERSNRNLIIRVVLILGALYATLFFIVWYADRIIRRQHEELQDTHLELEKRVRERTAELTTTNELLKEEIIVRKLTEDQAKQAKEAAEAASQAKSEFLSTMSHELRSPLGAVIGFSDLLLRDTKDEMVQQLVPKIRDSWKYLLAMIEEILDFDRIEAGKVSLKIEPTSINDLVSEVVNSWHSRLPGGFSLSLEIDPACGVVQCDSTRVFQILNNLIDNAVKYSPDGGIIEVRTRATSDEVCVSISDEGMGIEPEAKEVIFERFQQLEKGYRRRAGGLGIGLALARELIEMHGGRIWVDSEGGKGSAFSIALPRNRVPAQKVSGQDGDPEELADDGNPWDGRKILIVEDIEVFQDFIKMLVKSASRVFSASNGQEAIEAARRDNPDLILMDLRMPVLDGFEAIERLKSDSATRDIPIIAVTAQVMEEDRARSAQAGADGFVTKPIDIETFRKEVGRVLGVRV